MRPDGIVMPTPPLDQNLGLVERRELLSLQQLIAELGIEALAVPVLPWRSGLDAERLNADPSEPAAHALGDEFWTIFRTNVLRWTVPAHEIDKEVEDVIRAQPPRHDDRHAASRVFVDHVIVERCFASTSILNGRLSSV